MKLFVAVIRYTSPAGQIKRVRYEIQAETLQQAARNARAILHRRTRGGALTAIRFDIRPTRSRLAVRTSKA